MDVDEARKGLGMAVLSAAYTSACWAFGVTGAEGWIFPIFLGGVCFAVLIGYALFCE